MGYPSCGFRLTGHANCLDSFPSIFPSCFRLMINWQAKCQSQSSLVLSIFFGNRVYEVSATSSAPIDPPVRDLLSTARQRAASKQLKAGKDRGQARRANGWAKEACRSYALQHQRDSRSHHTSAAYLKSLFPSCKGAAFTFLRLASSQLGIWNERPPVS